MRFQSIALDDIYYPVKYQGSFESSDPLLNQIWEVGAYTEHLCMQEDIWDATKRDRARWAGDLDVSGRGIDDVFDDHFLMQDTMTNLLPAAPIKGARQRHLRLFRVVDQCADPVLSAHRIEGIFAERA